MKYLKNHKELLRGYIVIQRKEATPGFKRKYREHVVWRFPNQWGASLSCNLSTNFSPELAVLRYNGEEVDLAYNTSITNDVISNVSVVDLALYWLAYKG